MIARWWFLRLVGITYAIAFVSFRVQAGGLIGANGISPLPEFLAAVRQQVGDSGRWLVPTLCWLDSSDRFVRLLCDSGAVAGLVVASGFLQAFALLWCFIAYLSIQVAGQQFMGFQWDILLLETGFIALLWAPWSIRPGRLAEDLSSRIGRWLALWLLFRLMFASGLVKLNSADPLWRSLTALTVHHETQPLPTWVGWYAHQLPRMLQTGCCIVMFAIELGAPWLILIPRRGPRLVAFWSFLILMLLISATGNYGFFNLLTVILCLPLVGHADWPGFLRRPVEGVGAKPARNLPVGLVAPIGAVVGFAGLVVITLQSGVVRSWPRPAMTVYEQVAGLRIVNGYGLFAVMTAERHELTIEGSLDGRTWMPYPFRWKPQDPMARPGFVAPHMPRLDWMMWFAALGTPRQHPWIGGLCIRLLEGEPSVLRLLAADPFAGARPRSIRVMTTKYRFTGPGFGAWWERGPAAEYIPALTLRREP